MGTKEAAMGLKGQWAQIANLSAVAFVCVCFWQSQAAIQRSATEDRQMFREELRAQRESLDKVSHAVEQLSDEVRHKKGSK